MPLQEDLTTDEKNSAGFWSSKSCPALHRIQLSDCRQRRVQQDRFPFLRRHAAICGNPGGVGAVLLHATVAGSAANVADEEREVEDNTQL